MDTSNLRFYDPNRSILALTVTPDDELQKLAADAIMCQDACNTVALAKSFAEAVLKLKHHPSNILGGMYVSQHPITCAWLDKFCELAGIKRDISDYREACDYFLRVHDIKDRRTCEILFHPDSQELAYWRAKM